MKIIVALLKKIRCYAFLALITPTYINNITFISNA